MLEMDASQDEHRLYNQINDCCRQLSDTAAKYIKEIICCYIGDKDTIYEMPSVIEALQERDFNNVIHESEVFYLKQERRTHSSVQSEFPIAQWREWLRQGRYNQVEDDITTRLTSKEQRLKINREFLNKFIRDFYYLIFGFTHDRSIFINELLGDEESNQLFENASESLEGMLKWVNHAIILMRNFDKENANRDLPVEQTKSISIFIFLRNYRWN